MSKQDCLCNIFYSDDRESCTRSQTGVVRCVPSATSIPSISIPESNGNAYVLVNGSGEYNLKVQNTRGGASQAPILVLAGFKGDQLMRQIEVTQGAEKVIASWHRSLIIFPGFKTAVFSTEVKYSVMAINMDYLTNSMTRLLQKFHFDSICGLEYLLISVPSAVKLFRVPSPPDGEDGVDGSPITASLRGLRSGTNYKIVVWATCDEQCLQQVSKGGSKSAKITCTETTRCQPISFIYSATSFKTSGTVSSDDQVEFAADSFVNEIVSMAFMIVAGIVLVLLGFAWQYNTKLRHAAATRYFYQYLLCLSRVLISYLYTGIK